VPCTERTTWVVIISLVIKNDVHAQRLITVTLNLEKIVNSDVGPEIENIRKDLDD
jgi:hypothetical protein